LVLLPTFSLLPTGGLMPTRRIFELVVITSVLLWPAKGTVKLWARKTLATYPTGHVIHGVGEVLVNIL
jgi:hypothetical protein